MNELQVQKRFLADTQNHTMEALRDDGVYRHLRFSEGRSSHAHFDLITWPGYLCYAGDMGTFVFTRVFDMFDFFRTTRRENGEIRINPYYWMQKCESQDARGQGMQNFDADAFKREITERRRLMFAGYAEYMDADERQEFWDGLEEVKAAADDGEFYCWAKASDWSFRVKHPDRWGNPTTSISLDLSEFPDCKRYSHTFLWCCFALAWGIEQYDKSKEAAPA